MYIYIYIGIYIYSKKVPAGPRKVPVQSSSKWGAPLAGGKILEIAICRVGSYDFNGTSLDLPTQLQNAN